MKTRLITLTFALLLGMTLSAETKDTLKFREDGTFKILQITDTHIGNTSEGRYQVALETFRRFKKWIETEQPDLVVFTGDIITAGKVRPLWNTLMETMAESKTPFAVMFGNHDPEEDLTRAEMSEIIAASPYSFNTLNEKGELADIEIPILTHKGNSVSSVIYCMDSHDYSQMEEVEGYGWFTRDQVDWLYDSCVEMKEKEGRNVPSLAFFHIPLPEYVEAWNNRVEGEYVGHKGEDECPGAINTGMFAAMLESGSVMGVFTGHDHTSDYVVMKSGIALGYGRCTATHCYLRRGARIVVLKEGKREFESWIKREDDGGIDGHFQYKDGKMTEL